MVLAGGCIYKVKGQKSRCDGSSVLFCCLCFPFLRFATRIMARMECIADAHAHDFRVANAKGRSDLNVWSQTFEQFVCSM